jgi:exonuclease III
VVDLNRDSLNLRQDIRVATLNVRTLASAWKVEEGCHLMVKRQIDILCVQEHRIHKTGLPETSHSMDLEGGWRFCFGSAERERAVGGVGVLISPRLVPLLESQVQVKDHRLMQLNFRAHPGSLHIICAYAPTAVATEVQKEDVFAKLDCLLDVIPPGKMFIVCGNFNATVVESSCT